MMRSLALCCVLVFASVSAEAGEMRYPASGSPAVMVNIPDGWKAKEEDGKLKAAADDGSATVTISIMPYAGPMDALAEKTFQAENIDPSEDWHAVLVADMKGYWWPSQQKVAGEVRTVFFCDVELGDGKALTGLLISQEDDSPGYHAGLKILDHMKVVHE